jgi:hypothetical protein
VNDYLLLMHDDLPAGATEGGDEAWGRYLAWLRERGGFGGGSAIGGGVCMAKGRAPAPLAAHLTGFLRIQAASLDEARALVAGNPVYEAGGTVEIRELPRSG